MHGRSMNNFRIEIWYTVLWYFMSPMTAVCRELLIYKTIIPELMHVNYQLLEFR